ncbi:MAG: hypothetical protein QOI10_2086 [Solirubrobacterales bacterium]|nr:hypothetical protein [Solirubrobacterales bacterium]
MTESLDPGKEARAAHNIPIVPSFDGYRAVAIFLIVAFHVCLFSGVAGAVGDSWRGVAIFGLLPRVPLTMLFVVSGFVLFLPTAARGGRFGSVGDYALRRAARILPAYWLSLAVAIVLLAVLSLPIGVPSVGEALLHATMLQTPATLFDGDFALGFGIVPSVWTLSVETVFYIALPLVAGAWYRRPFVGLALAAALLVVWRLFALHIGDLGAGDAARERWDVFYASQFPSWGLSFAAGMTGAWLYVRLRETVPVPVLSRRAPAVAAVAAIAAAVVVIFAGHEAVNDPNVLAGLFARQSLAVALCLPLTVATAMVAVALSPPRAQAVFANRPLRSLGDISYGVYLIHLAVIAVIVSELSLPRTGSVGAFAAWLAIVVPVSLGYAYLSATLLERPLRRWARRARPGRVSVAPPDPNLPAVSIVIPTFNRETWLAGALDSVLEQDYANLEAVVVDDGSSDATPALLRGYAHRWPEHRFRFIRQQNAGQATAINRGNREARGEILGYLSDDDELLPGAVSRLAGELIANPAAAVAYPGYREIDGEGRVEDTIRPIEYRPLEALRLHDTVIGPGGLARRFAIERAGGWDPGLRWLGDLILWMRVGLAGPAIRVPEPLALWRRHPDSATVRLSSEHAREHLRCAEIGAGLEGIGPLTVADRAEALRNACVFAALFGGGGGWPGDRFVAFDLHRRRISAATSKLGPDGEIDWGEAERATELYRELVALVAPASATAGAGGLELARAKLAEVGALPGGDADPIDDAGRLGTALLEAAFACGAEIDRARARFVICDRSRARIDDDELDELNRLGFGASADELAAAAARRR